MFQRFLHEFRVVLFDVVMRSNGMLELVAHDHAGSLRRRTADEEHDTTAALVIGRLQQRDGHGQSHSGRA